MVNDDSSSRVDLNQADVETLTTLPGIGPKLAERIIHYRQEVHPFEEAIELTAVPGISERMYREFAEQVTVSQAESVLEPAQPPVEPEDIPDGEVAEADTPPAEKILPKKPTAAPPRAEPGPVVPHKETTEVAQPVADKPAPPPVKSAAYMIQADEPATESEEGYIISLDEEETGGNFWRPWLLMIVGALLGTFLTLLILYGINGGRLVIAPTVEDLEREVSTLKEQEASISNEIDELQERVEQFDALSTRLQNTETEIQILKQSRDTLAGEIESLQSEASAMATRVVTLEEQATTLSGQVETLEENNQQMQELIDELQTETGRFDDFLTRLRDLLLTVQGTPAAPPASPTAESTAPPASTPTFTPTPTPTPTATSPPTGSSGS